MTTFPIHNPTKSKKITTLFWAICISTTFLKCNPKPKIEQKKSSTESTQLNATVLTKKDFQEDYKLFRQIFENANAGIYRHRSKQQVDSLFSVNASKINNETTSRLFYNLLWEVIDFSGSLHNNLSYPKHIKSKLYNEEIFFPIPLKYIEGNLYSNSNDTIVPAGAQLLNIEGLATNDFIKKVSKYRSTDGFNKTQKAKYLQTDWAPAYIYFALGRKEDFKITYSFNGITKTTSLKGISYYNYFKKFNNRYSKVFENKKQKSYQYKVLDSLNIGVLTISTFNLGQKGDHNYTIFKEFLESTFSTISNNTKLIIDIRGNNGGTADALMLLTSYLSPRKVKENTKAFALFNNVPFAKYFTGSIPETENFLTTHFNQLSKGKFYQNQKYNPVWLPQKNRFKGHFVLLTDAFVASAASHFAAHLKSDRQSVIIGEETGGGYYGHTGHYPVNYQLPNSKFIVNFSIINLDQDVITLQDQIRGRGIIPDLYATQSLKDFIKHEDTVLKRAIQYLNKHTKVITAKL